MKRPMIYWVILFVLGEVLGHQFTISQLVYMIAAIAVLFIAIAVFYQIRRNSSRRRILRNHTWVWWSGIVFLLLGCVCITGVKNKIAVCKALENQEVLLEGRIVKCTKTDYNVQYIARVTVGKQYHISVLADTTETNLIPGDEVQIKGRVTAFNQATNPGEYDEETYQYAKGIFLKIEEAAICKKEISLFSVSGILYQIRARMVNVYQQEFSAQYASLAGAMVLGDKAGLDNDMKELYQKNGIAHLIAISGLHIAMIGGTLYHILRKMLGSYGLSAAAGAAFIILYGVMTGLSGATLRAIIMLLAVMGADVCGRRYDGISAIALALLVMLVNNPYQLREAGFLLSFGAILGITWLLPVWNMFFKKLPRWLDGLGVSICVQIMTLPITLWFFYEIPVWGIFLNLIVVPLMSVLLVFLILCGTAGVVHLHTGQVLALPAKWIFELYEWLCRYSEQLPCHRICLGRPTAIFIILYYGILMLFVMLQYTKKPCWLNILMKKSKWKRASLLCYVFVTAGLFVMQSVSAKLKICVLDVGQGDGIYIETPEHVHILIDGGSSTRRQLGKYVLENAVKYHGTARLHYVFVTHSDSDHYSGVSELLQDGNIVVDNLVLPAITNPDEAYLELVRRARENGIHIFRMQAGDSIQLGKMQLVCLNPQKEAYEDKNTGSLVILASYKDFDMLFTGDMDEEAEQRLLEEHVLENMHIELLKVAHHGSATASSEAFLKQLRPETAVISVAETNQYGHPAKAVMERLNRFCKKIYLTKDCGAVTIDTNGRQYFIESFLPVKKTE